MERNIEQRPKIKEAIIRVTKPESVVRSLFIGGLVGTAYFFLLDLEKNESITSGAGFSVAFYSFDQAKVEIPALYRKVKGRIREKSK